MKSYTALRTAFGQDIKSTLAANLTYGDERANDYYRQLLSKADWPFLHRLRTITTVATTATITANATTDVLTATDNTILTNTGTEVTFSTTGTLPAGLATSTTYYLIYQSTTTFKVATSLANAYAGTAIDITDAGTGTHTITINTEFQPLPYDMDLVESVFVTVSGTRYDTKPSPSRKHWDELHYSSFTSNIPQYWYVHESQIGIWPRPSSSGNVISINGKIRVPDLNIADYTTGNIDIVTNGSILITGAGTPSWNTTMAGKWIRITHSATAASSGDSEWYEIVSVPSSTTLTIARPYGGRSLTTGAAAAYTIGQMPILPEAYHDLPYIYANYRYWLKEKDERNIEFKKMVEEKTKDLFMSYSFNDLTMVIDEGIESDNIINPNLTIRL